MLKPFCHVQSFTDIGPSSTCHQFYSGETTFEEAQKRQNTARYSNTSDAFNGNINSKTDKDNDLHNDIQVNELPKQIVFSFQMAALVLRKTDNMNIMLTIMITHTVAT